MLTALVDWNHNAQIGEPALYVGLFYFFLSIYFFHAYTLGQCALEYVTQMLSVVNLIHVLSSTLTWLHSLHTPLVSQDALWISWSADLGNHGTGKLGKQGSQNELHKAQLLLDVTSRLTVMLTGPKVR